MTAEVQTLLTVSVPTIAVPIGILVNNSRLGDMNARMGEMRTHFDRRIDEIKETWRAETPPCRRGAGCAAYQPGATHGAYRRADRIDWGERKVRRIQPISDDS